MAMDNSQNKKKWKFLALAGKIVELFLGHRTTMAMLVITRGYLVTCLVYNMINDIWIYMVIWGMVFDFFLPT